MAGTSSGIQSRILFLVERMGVQRQIHVMNAAEESGALWKPAVSKAGKGSLKN